MRYFISLGSNLGNRRKNLIRAVSLLKKSLVKIIKASSLYETFPVGFITQPWFMNRVLEIETDMQPESFLLLVKSIEKGMGRKQTIQNGPRCIDIDILLAENRVVQTEKLQIPHPELNKRNFVLIPLSEISPNTVHPVIHKKIEELCRLCQDTSAVMLFDEEK
jgi:2-amino-4-hydroxy-6-hydroxymethyldihydropteridine diphosphokinase